MKKIKLFALALVALFSISATAQTTEKGKYSERTISDDLLTSTWNYVNVVSSQTNCTETDNDILYTPSSSSKLKVTSQGLSCNSSSSIYIPVPAGSAGKISLNPYSSSDSRWFQLLINGTDAGVNKRLWSKPGDDLEKKGPQSFDFTSADITTKDGKTYLHLQDNAKEMKVGSITVTLTTGKYGVSNKAFITALTIADTEVLVSEEETTYDLIIESDKAAPAEDNLEVTISDYATLTSKTVTGSEAEGWVVTIVVTAEDGETSNTYTINVSRAAAGSGALTLIATEGGSLTEATHADGDAIAKDEVLVLTATPAEGYHLVSVEADGTALTAEADGTYKWTVNGSVTIKATFAINTYTVTVTLPAETDGTIKVGDLVEGDNTVEHGTVLALSHTTVWGRHFLGFTINGEDYDGDSYTVTGPATIAATYDACDVPTGDLAELVNVTDIETITGGNGITDKTGALSAEGAEVEVNYTATIQGGGKIGANGHYITFTIPSGWQVGDVIEITCSTASNTTEIHFTAGTKSDIGYRAIVKAGDVITYTVDCDMAEAAAAHSNSISIVRDDNIIKQNPTMSAIKISRIQAAPQTEGIVYELNGGSVNEYGWTCPQDMYNDITAIADEVKGSTRGWLTLQEISDSLAHYGAFSGTKDAAGNTTGTWANANTFSGGTYYSTTEAQNTAWVAFQEKMPAKFQWLLDYMEAKADKTLDFGLFRNNVTAFFSDNIWRGWPASADYTTCGVSTYSAYASYWKSAYDNPTEVEAEFTLNAPYKENSTFLGWYDNPDGTGEAITTIDATTVGTLYAIWQGTGGGTALENVNSEVNVVKVIENGQVVIIREGVRYNVLGVKL